MSYGDDLKAFNDAAIAALKANKANRDAGTPTTYCDDCDAITTVTLEPYGAGKMAVISCPNCGISYDTNLDESEAN